MSRPPSAARWVAGIVLAVAAAYLVWRIRATLGALGAGFIVAYAIEPAVARLERWHVPRPVGAVLIALLVAGVIGAAIVFAAPVFVGQVSRFVATVSFDALFEPAAWPRWLRGYIAAADSTELKAQAAAWVRANGLRAIEHVGNGLARLTSSFAGLIVSLLNVIVVPVFAVYLIIDYHEIRRGAMDLVPQPARPEALRVAREIDAVLRAFIKGQTAVALALGAMYAIGLTILGTPLAVLIGVAAGLLNVVPYLGIVSGLPPALLLNFLEHQSWARLLGVVLVFLVAQSIEGWILTPRLLGTSLGLHPVVVVLAIMIGGELFGFAGILLAVPAAAVLSVFAREALARYRASRLYREGWAPPGAAAPVQEPEDVARPAGRV